MFVTLWWSWAAPRFGEMNVEDAIKEIVHTTHSMFDVDGAGLMLCDADQHLRTWRPPTRGSRTWRTSRSPSGGSLHRCLRHQAARRVRRPRARRPVARLQPAAVGRRVRAVLASPLPYNQDAVGVVAVVSEDSHPWSPEGELALLAFTDLAALLIASMMQGRSVGTVAAAAGCARRPAGDRAGERYHDGDARVSPRGRPTSSCGRAPGRAPEAVGRVRGRCAGGRAAGLRACRSCQMNCPAKE